MATEWLSLNIADIFTGGLAAYSTYKLYKKSKNGELDESTVIWATIGIGVKMSSGILTTNPILILSGVADIAILITNLEEAEKAFKRFCDFIFSSEFLAAISSLFAGSATAGIAFAGVSVFGVASTGTTIAALSGAAATNATWAAIGGGSIAAGGLGVTGGLIVLTGGSAIVGLALGYGIYTYLKKGKRVV
jgi:hypothetical protein